MNCSPDGPRHTVSLLRLGKRSMCGFLPCWDFHSEPGSASSAPGLDWRQNISAGNLQVEWDMNQGSWIYIQRQRNKHVFWSTASKGSVVSDSNTLARGMYLQASAPWVAFAYWSVKESAMTRFCWQNGRRNSRIFLHSDMRQRLKQLGHAYLSFNECLGTAIPCRYNRFKSRYNFNK